MRFTYLVVACIFMSLVSVRSVFGQTNPVLPTPPHPPTTPSTVFAPVARPTPVEVNDGTPTMAETISWLKQKLESTSATIEYEKVNKSFERVSGRALVVSTDIETETSSTEDLKIEACTLSWRTSIKRTSTHSYVDTLSSKTGKPVNHALLPPTSSSISLSDMDPLGIKVVEILEPWVIAKRTDKEFANSKDFRSETSYELAQPVWMLVLDGGPLDSNLSTTLKHAYTDHTILSGEMAYVGFLFNDRELAKRVLKATQHAITKCGGKVEPF